MSGFLQVFHKQEFTQEIKESIYSYRDVCMNVPSNFICNIAPNWKPLKCPQQVDVSTLSYGLMMERYSTMKKQT